MVDVYVVSARGDSARAGPITEALRARGFGVEWDNGPSAAPQAALDAAKAVVVLWTPAAVKDKRVKDAAGRAGDRLVQVVLQNVELEPPFKQMPAETLTLWPSIAGTGAFERLVLVLESRTAKTAGPASLVPQSVLDAAERASAKRGPAGQIWSLITTLIGISLIVAVIGFVAPMINQATDSAPKTEQTTSLECGAAQKYCLTEEDLKTGSEAKLWSAALEHATREDLQAGATDGDALSAGLLCLVDAFSPKGDAAAAPTSCKAAAQMESPLGNLGLAALFTEGKPPTPADPAAARQLLAAAAKKGDARSQFRLAENLYNDNDFKGALESLADCLPSGYDDCRYLKAYMLENGQGEPANIPEAVRLYTALAEQSPPYAAAARSLAYLMQTGVPGQIEPNLKYAVTLYRRAEVMGDGFSSFMLGDLALAGKIEGEGRAEAREYYRKAVSNGYAPAAEALAKLR